MSGSSDKMLALLHQLSVLHQLEDQSATDTKSGSALRDSKSRRLTRQQIGAEMKQLASHARRESSK
jgi:hypothetical protein